MKHIATSVSVITTAALAAYGTEVGWQHFELLWILFVLCLLSAGASD